MDKAHEIIKKQNFEILQISNLQRHSIPIGFLNLKIILKIFEKKIQDKTESLENIKPHY